MKTNLFKIAKFTGIAALLLLIWTSCVSKQSNTLSQDDQYGGNQIPGTWTGKQNMQVRFTNGWFKFQFISSPDSVSTQIQIDEEGNVSGLIGNARLVNASVIKNRGAIGRTFHLATDYSIRGELIGPIFEGDTIGYKKIQVPFFMENGKLNGDVFQKQGMDVFPMCTILLNKS